MRRAPANSGPSQVTIAAVFVAALVVGALPALASGPASMVSVPPASAKGSPSGVASQVATIQLTALRIRTRRSPAPAARPSRVVAAIGPWSMTSPNLAGATRAFGRPTSCRENGRTPAVARWARLGLTAYFQSLPRNSKRCADPVAWVVMTGRRFVTEAGLRVGDSRARLRQLYPAATLNNGFWWLTTAFDGLSGSDFPSVYASVRQGRVIALAAGIWAGGD